jgi:hypothetical protein
MALITCPECKKQISDTTDSCPNCGYKLTPGKINEIKKKSEAVGKKVGIGCLVVFIAFGCLCAICYNMGPDKSKPAAPLTRTEQLAKHFNPWDGSHIGLTETIKAAMNDPDSYKHVETRYIDKGDYLIVTTTYRGKNSFGGVVTNRVQAKVDLNGNVLQIISQ